MHKYLDKRMKIAWVFFRAKPSHVQYSLSVLWWCGFQSDIADVPNDGWMGNRKRKGNPAVMLQQKDSERLRAAPGQNPLNCCKEGKYMRETVEISVSINPDCKWGIKIHKWVRESIESCGVAQIIDEKGLSSYRDLCCLSLLRKIRSHVWQYHIF